ncbi:STAS domain-containing protein [Pelagibacterium flavum]|uniref:STAS domain-containing protein n=1 Tax=Pelagibacterium flavum TaxID=2984530 RepID=A0ABY6IQ13_9HYPH|nr:STAS domain-containing protein [Pelagibacterium sp. YIM 151497]MAN76048.1 anti-anti-sigma factor [Hyphomicrobiales bacterium]UYQ72693.1 STAS domain-containing protein [Pelagibacterium sp. YIM 151497]|tara:strand:+ start:825 stop:1115 length:291 start_codon:yes stop_codon:yes gene_type:complete
MAKSQVQSVALPRIVDLDALDDVAEKLIGALSAGSVNVDASGVERVSTNALFMLLSAAETAKKAKFAFTISGASTSVVAAIEKLGLNPAFEPVLKG